MTDADYERLANALAPVIKEYVAKALAPTEDALEAYSRRLIEVEKGGIRYRGIFQRADVYARGDVVTHGGSAWIALNGVEGAVPGQAESWQLMCKRGADGKDAR
jgi:hypothetical protein